MKTIWRLFRITILLLAALLVGLVLVLVSINAFDEDLAPETKALLAAPPNQYSAEQNLYLALLGIDAPPGESSIAFGQARIAEYERDLAATLKDPRVAVAKLEKANSQTFAFKGKVDFCKPLTTSVWTGIETHKTDIERLLNDNQELYQRYLALHRLPGYYETATPSMYAPLVYPHSLLVRSLFLADLALRMKSRNAAQQSRALTDLEADIHAWRTMLIGDGSLVSKMIAIASLQGDFLMLGDMIADSTIDVSGLSSELDRIVMPFDQGDWKIGKSFAHEFRLVAPLWEQMDPGASAFWAYSDDEKGEPSNWWERCWNSLGGHFFKKRATENLSAKVMLQVIKMADAEPTNLSAARDAYAHWVQEHLNFGVRYAYNPGGKILVGIAVPGYETYPLRAYDVAALQRLVQLVYEIRRRQIPAEQVPAFMQQHPELATHPVNGQAFSWDADKNEVTVTPLAEQPKGRRFSVPVWKGTKTIARRIE